MKSKSPIIEKTEIVARSRIFKIEAVDLKFSNGECRTFERSVPRSEQAVMVIPIVDPKTILIIREYGAGVERYELGFPKGVMEDHEAIFEAANREMMEEVGYGAHKMTLLKTMTAIPNYLKGIMHCVVAEDLYPQQLAGDEPEPLEVIAWPVAKIDELIMRDDFTEGRCIAAALMVKDYLSKIA